MKKVIFILLALTIGAGSFAQNATKDSLGNYKAISRIADSTAPKTITGATYEDGKGVKFPVYISLRGKEFIIRTSKTGRTYKMYIKL